MRNMLLTTFAAAILTAGCSTTRFDLNAENSTTTQAQLAISPELAYRNVVDGVRGCYRKSIWRIDADYFPDNRSATIYVAAKATASTEQAIFLMRLVPNGTNSAAMSITYRGGPGQGWSSSADAAASWAAGGNAPCPLPE